MPQENNVAPAPSMLLMITRYIRSGLAVPRDPGLILDSVSLISSLILSLVPEWAPEGNQPLN